MMRRRRMPTPIPAPIDAIKIKGSGVGVTLTLPLSSDKACNRKFIRHAIAYIKKLCFGSFTGLILLFRSTSKVR